MADEPVDVPFTSRLRAGSRVTHRADGRCGTVARIEAKANGWLVNWDDGSQSVSPRTHLQAETDRAFCPKCGDRDPFHVHFGDSRIDDYFTVGRGLDALTSANYWKARALAADALNREMSASTSTERPLRPEHGLRGRSVLDAALSVVAPNESVHYREVTKRIQSWFGAIAGKEPEAVVLTHLSRASEFAPHGRRSGLYQRCPATYLKAEES